jgi:hypothetical protein
MLLLLDAPSTTEVKLLGHRIPDPEASLGSRVLG